VTRFNTALAFVFDVLLAPLADVPPLGALAIVALPTAAIMLWTLRAWSDQQRLVALKRQIHACLFECRLFQDDLAAVFRALGEIGRRNVLYLWLSLRPMFWAALPFALVLTQLDSFFGYRTSVRQPLLVTARVAESAVLSAGPESPVLEAPPGVGVLTPPIWIPATRELIWRIEAHQSGHYMLRIHVGSAVFGKTLMISDAISRHSVVRPAPGILSQLTNPGEAPLPSGAMVSELRIGYARSAIEVMGWQLPWLVVYLGLTTIWAMLLKRPMRVTL
jgi:hypothetical protein